MLFTFILELEFNTLTRSKNLKVDNLPDKRSKLIKFLRTSWNKVNLFLTTPIWGSTKEKVKSFCNICKIIIQIVHTGIQTPACVECCIEEIVTALNKQAE